MRGEAMNRRGLLKGLLAFAAGLWPWMKLHAKPAKPSYIEPLQVWQWTDTRAQLDPATFRAIVASKDDKKGWAVIVYLCTAKGRATPIQRLVDDDGEVFGPPIAYVWERYMAEDFLLSCDFVAVIR